MNKPDPETFKVTDDILLACPQRFRVIVTSYLNKGKFDYPQSADSVEVITAFVATISGDFGRLCLMHNEGMLLEARNLYRWLNKYAPEKSFGSDEIVGSWISFVNARNNRDKVYNAEKA